MDLMTMWKQARGEVALPEPDEQVPASGGGIRWVWSAAQMRAIATPDPETLRRFAEMVAEECARVCLDDAAGCQRAAEMMVDGEECARFDAMAGVLLDAAAAIRRHVKG